MIIFMRIQAYTFLNADEGILGEDIAFKERHVFFFCRKGGIARWVGFLTKFWIDIVHDEKQRNEVHFQEMYIAHKNVTQKNASSLHKGSCKNFLRF